LELTVINEDKGTGNAMGLMIKSADLSLYMPGWEPGTYAMHSDDGHAYFNNDTSIYHCKSFAFGPAYQQAGVVIGCGYNFSTREIFFTHNGLMIGVAFVIPNTLEIGDICPCVGMKTIGSVWRINVGQKPFLFNIDGYICGDNIEELNGLIFDESEAGTSQYRMSRSDTIEKMKKGENFLKAFVPLNSTVEPTEQDNDIEDDEENPVSDLF